MASGTRAALRRQTAATATQVVAPVAAPAARAEDEPEFYKTFGIVPTKRDRDDALQSLFKPVPRSTPDHYHAAALNSVQQMDLLALPEDTGHKFALVVIDLATRLTDAEPLTSKSATAVLAALKTIYSRSELRPPHRMEVDAGKEFQGGVATYLKTHGTMIRVGRPGRHQQQGAAENINRILGRAISIRQHAQELLTGEPSKEWVSDLPAFVAAINKRLHRTPPPLVSIDKPPIIPRGGLLREGTRVRVRLDRAETIRGERLHGEIRAGDVKWDPTIRTIEQLIIHPGEPVKYIVSGIRSTAFQTQELQIVHEGEKMPPKSVLRGASSQVAI